MRPESTSVTFEDSIAALVQEYLDDRANGKFVGRRIAPIFRHPAMEGSYPIFRRDGFKKRTDDTRAADGGYPRLVFEFGKGTFDTTDRGLESVVDQRTRKRFRNLFDAEVATVKPLVTQILMNHEYRVANLFATASFTSHSPTAVWSSSSTAVPLTDLQTGINTLCDTCGCQPSDISLIIPRTDYMELLACTQVANKCQYTYPGVIPNQLSPDEVTAMLKIKEAIVCSSAADSAEEGYAETNASIWTPGTVYLAVIANEGDDLTVPSAARTIVHDGLSDDLSSVEVEAMVNDMMIIESYEEARSRGRVFRVRAEYDQVLQVADDPDCLVYKLTT